MALIASDLLGDRRVILTFSRDNFFESARRNRRDAIVLCMMKIGGKQSGEKKTTGFDANMIDRSGCCCAIS